MRIVNVAGYRFVKLTNLTTWWEQLLSYGEQLHTKGTIILSSEGINVNLAGDDATIRQFTEYLTSFPELSGMQFKYSYSETIPFRRFRVKIKAELIPTDQPEITFSYQPKYLPPTQLCEWLATDSVTVIDTRNEFEYAIGTFDRAVNLHLTNFREFATAIQTLDAHLKEQPVVIFCTGGIRCEKAAPIMEQQGFQQVYQLEGGILNYFAECGTSYYHGKCFVFDDRIALNSRLQPEA